MNRIKLAILLFFFVTVSVFSQEKKYTAYQAKKGETVYSISRLFAITPHDLLKLNPDIKDNNISENQLIIVPNKDYKLERDSEQGGYVKDGFLYHKVLPKENYFRLKKQFGVPKRILRKHNLALRTNDLKVGQVIKIPVKDDFIPSTVQAEDTSTKPYLVKPKETKYSIARRYGITLERLVELNPYLKEEELKMAAIIKVPNTMEIPNSDEGFIVHQVEKGETFFSLSQQFKISQEQLKEFNPELEDGVKEGMLIKIPTEFTGENTSVFIPNIYEDRQLKVAMLLPFTTNKKKLDFENDRTLSLVTDFYLGALMAMDSLKKQGLSVSVKVFDTKNNKAAISNILKLNNLADMDAILGPMFLDNVKFVSHNVALDSVALISPVSSKDHVEFASKSIIKDIPSDDIVIDKMLSYIIESYSGQHLVVIADDKKENELRLNKITEKLNAIDSIQDIVVLKPEEGYIKPDLFRETIIEDKENWVVLITEDNVVTADVVNNLGVLPEEFKITLFGSNFGKNFDRIDNNFLARVNFHYPTTSFIDYENSDVQKFVKNYKKKNFMEPSEFAFKGFDITYDALLRLASYEHFESAFDGGISERMSCKFEYFKKPYKGFENKGVFLVKYDGLYLKKVK